MPPANAPMTGGTLPSPHDTGSLLATAGKPSINAAVPRLASSRASLTREVVTMNEDVANNADTKQATMAAHSPAVAPTTA